MTDVAHPLRRRASALALGVNVGLLVFIALYAAIAVMQPNYLEVAGFTNFLRRAAPLAVLACGQLFVVVAGGFDLSMGALVTLTVLGGSMLTAGDPDATWWVIPVLYGIGLLVGTINGLVVSYLKVPSIIATLGMLLSLNGVAYMWTGGSPRGALPENFRLFGRFVFRDVPGLGVLPLAVLVLLVVVALAAWLLHRTAFGRRVFAVGDNPRAAELAGVQVNAVRISVFILSALFAVTGGIMLGGFAGVSMSVGDGLELQAIAACVIGGALLLGGRGSMLGVVAGALSLYALFTLLNLLGMPQPIRDTAQGIILIAAVAVGALRRRRA
ncbi:MAG: ABC transporter permease [Rhizobiales bacterium]|nr:ABC transporter permease [Hyphomicrobiales bacterium]